MDSLSEQNLVSDVSLLVQHFDAALDQAWQYHEHDQLFLAHKTVKMLQNAFHHHKKAASTYGAEVQAQLETIGENLNQQEQRINTIKKQRREVKNLIHELRSNEGWKLVRETDGVKTHYRHEESTPVHSLKMEGVINSPALNIMAIMNEHTLYDTWIPLVKNIRLVKQMSRYTKALHMSVSLPWPLSSRDAVLYGYGVDALEEDIVIVMIRSATPNDLTEDEMPPEKDYVRVDTKFAGVMLRPLSESATHVIMMTNTDPKLQYIPYSFLNWATKTLSWTMWSTLSRHARKIEGSQYEKLIKENPDFYGNIQQKLASYFGTQSNDHESSD